MKRLSLLERLKFKVEHPYVFQFLKVYNRYPDTEELSILREREREREKRVPTNKGVGLVLGRSCQDLVIMPMEKGYMKLRLYEILPELESLDEDDPMHPMPNLALNIMNTTVLFKIGES